MTIEIVKEPEPIDFDAHMAAHNASVKAAEAEPAPKPVEEKPIIEKAEEKPPAVETKEEKPGEKKTAEVIDDAQLVTDPDTGEKVDKRTREGKRIFSLLERAHKAEAMIASLLAKQPPAKEEKPAEAPVAPKPEDFPTTEAYIAAAVQFGIDQHLPAAVRAATQGFNQSRETETRNTAIDLREAKFLETHPDYREVLKTGLLPDLSAGVAAKHPTAIAIQRVLQTSEDGPRLAYLLGKDAALHARLAALPPESALLELGKLASVPAKPADEVEKPKPRSQAPPPPEVPEARTTVAESDPMNLSFDEHVAAGNAADRRAAKARHGAAA